MNKQHPPSESQLQDFRNALENFQVFTDAEWNLFGSKVTCRQLSRKEQLIGIGEVCRDITYLALGSVRYYLDRDGELITNYFSFSGELVGAYGSFISGKPSNIGIDAIEDCQLLVLNEANMAVLASAPGLIFKFEQMRRRIAEFIVLCYEDRVLSLITKSPEERYLKLLETSAEVFRKIPQHFIAHFLGITPVSLSRIRNRSRHTAAHSFS